MLLTQLLAQFGDKGFQPEDSSFYIDSSSAGAAQDSALSNLESFISQLLGFLTVTASLFFIVYFFLGAFKWITAGGESGKVNKARDEMIQATMGLIVIVASYGVIGLIGTILGLDILTPRAQIEAILEMRN